MRIGVLRRRWTHYSYTRSVLHKVPEVEYVPIDDVFSWLAEGMIRLNAYSRRVLKRQIGTHFNLNNQFYDFGLNRVDVIHLFNGLSYGRTPWVTTFETAVPRFLEVMQGLRNKRPVFTWWQRWRFKQAMRALASPSCLALLPLSQSAARAQQLVLQWTEPSIAKMIEAKTFVLHPPQPLVIKSWREKQEYLQGPLHFMFVGHDFFRKGGLEMLEAFVQIRRRTQVPFRLTIVSALQAQDYATGAGEEEVRRAHELINANAEWVSYYPSLPNEQVLSLMRQAHVGLLPTYADSYGYVVLEFQASGCPVITTNTGALAEINAAERGWLIEVPRDHIGRAMYYTAEGKAAISKAIREGILAIVEEILSEPERVQRKGQAAWEYVRTNHDPAQHAETLRSVYARYKQVVGTA